MIFTLCAGRCLACFLSVEFYFAQAEGSESEAVYYNYMQLHKAVKRKKSGEQEKARALWSVNEAKDKGIDVYDPGARKMK